MEETEYANIFKKSHVSLIKMLTTELKDCNVVTVGYGNRTQHIYKDNKYFMTINWQLV
jgi:hypothetical protein